MAYYEQRAGAGLLVTEGTTISEQSFGWYGVSALCTDEHEAAWKQVVDRVHAKSTKIFLQLWHMGRQSHSSSHSTNEIVSASAIQYVGGRTRDANGQHTMLERPRALKTEEVPDVVDMYHQSVSAVSTNQRTDKYGGSFESCYHFLHEIVEALKTMYLSGRIAMRLSPNGTYGGMDSDDNAEMFTYALEHLSEHGLAYLAILDGFSFGRYANSRPLTVFDVKKAFKGSIMANNSYTRNTAEGVLQSGAADLVSFVRLFLSNPDLAERFQND
ncbi:hypothetical protein BBO99_00008684 [Phytophthora kernoviae]|uniref:NADH:flavin oxidoreductase/NADH oxidase N-terminal domain-containing protein n=2 Tax=Phytophthora kernoviae TaxID=325452 RepID=A0A3R7J350_9STRA|nr:hypothetical protein G195_010139 [Phytophthora kernoviae 00238/432]KAG2508736.1 hypothetical protein JM16_008728 [Phytophthora kernoviae]KAG2510899.1 hypothetical protein JM18_008779 [Phytophthora kernoviae]RLN11008.1 hypothetical protein BBI17_008787 [Phytophthora kernoviae]RLN74888.1 hypothetical protein BBO99_00008684 [Phytophthora kernoviae]